MDCSENKRENLLKLTNKAMINHHAKKGKAYDCTSRKIRKNDNYAKSTRT
jgi:hypothetical protein